MKKEKRIFSLIETAKENGIDPYAYPLHVLKTAAETDLILFSF